MPNRKLEAFRVGPKRDRRIKLSPKDKEKIVQLWKSGVSQRELARTFDVSRRLISFIVDPEQKVLNDERRAERGGWKAYYQKEKHRKYMSRHRQYKKMLKERFDLLVHSLRNE
jgi:hypothetical protein